MAPPLHPVVVSAPGKVLLAGGYLVLDPAYPGVVVSTSSRFYSVVEVRDAKGKCKSSVAAGAEEDAAADILVRSPQFVRAEWGYKLRIRGGTVAEGSSVDVIQTASSYNSPDAGKNPFVGLALLYCHRLALELLGLETYKERIAQPITITVVGDNDFYSQRSQANLPVGSEPSERPNFPKAPTSAYLRSLRPFTPLGVPIREVHKTGLGSSAAMTTSLVGALLAHLGIVSALHAASSATSNCSASAAGASLSTRDLALVHNTAQLAHCAAQGKVGSGFDVSAAVWGSQLYRRFKPEVLQAVLDEGAAVLIEGQQQVEDSVEPYGSSSTTSKRRLYDALKPDNRDWVPLCAASGSSKHAQGGDLMKTGGPTATEGLAALGLTVTAPFSSSSSTAPSSSEEHIPQPAPLHLPPRLAMVLADVDTGSNTPSLVSKVLAWKKAKPEWAKQLYSVLDNSNQSLADGLLALTLGCLKNREEYEKSLDIAAGVKSAKWDELARTHPSPSLTLLVGLRNTLRSIRAGMRELGQRAIAPVEPDEMGELIRASCESAPGVLGGGVPGAGGYDALYLLYITPRADASPSADPRATVEKFWASWQGLSVGPLLSTAGSSLSDAISSASAAAENEGRDVKTTLHPDLPDLALQFGAPSLGCSGLQLVSVDHVWGLREVL
ncbi:ribosomal protein S5 domain 2-like protein [Tilletiaria anomala UBC 951]|uniref:phosphomevalonate kinase n=1 Tax=Tilletiaria anomala (strain ATCC 24038 / CBS 436.72 / UBC 951) TaxID=1037660 RepID=A0A066VJC4_TILAU|nr:ribosomal protein S5 domain 2-like protein [Tilletiaria anomala UBC 951]KDN41596.1 ribosomal protein S5 domain 2-like protein [Tilletiaria anomala UBC 951]